MTYDKKRNLKNTYLMTGILSFRMCGIYDDLSVKFGDQKVFSLLYRVNRCPFFQLGSCAVIKMFGSCFLNDTYLLMFCDG